MNNDTTIGITDDRTPFIDQHLRYLKWNNEDFSRALEMIDRRPNFVLEGMGGFGTQSEIIQARWPGVPHRAYEHDERCFQQLAQRQGVDAVHGSYQGTRNQEDRLPAHSLLVLDSNTFTLLPRRVEAYRWMFMPEAEWIILTDVSMGKLHLHPKAYGIDEPTMEAYAARLAEVLSRDLVGFVKSKGFVTYIVTRRRP